MLQKNCYKKFCEKIPVFISVNFRRPAFCATAGIKARTFLFF